MALLIQNCRIVNEGEIRQGDIRIAKGRISAIGNTLSARQGEKALDAKGMLLLPGLIDDQVHFRQPGLTHKADIFHESRAARRRRSDLIYGYAKCLTAHADNGVN